MQNLFQSKTLTGAFSKATGRQASSQTKASREQVYAPPSVWGPFVTLFAQYGITGENPESHTAKINIYFSSLQGSSPFAVEIIGGDEVIYTSGPGSATVTITGNIATEIRIRCKSLNITGQNILVTYDS